MELERFSLRAKRVQPRQSTSLPQFGDLGCGQGLLRRLSQRLVRASRQVVILRTARKQNVELQRTCLQCGAGRAVSGRSCTSEVGQTGTAISRRRSSRGVIFTAMVMTRRVYLETKCPKSSNGLEEANWRMGECVTGREVRMDETAKS